MRAERQITFPIRMVFTVDHDTSFLRSTKSSQLVCFQ